MCEDVDSVFPSSELLPQLKITKDVSWHEDAQPEPHA